jgi:hypothetical protein
MKHGTCLAHLSQYENADLDTHYFSALIGGISKLLAGGLRARRKSGCIERSRLW